MSVWPFGLDNGYSRIYQTTAIKKWKSKVSQDTWAILKYMYTLFFIMYIRRGGLRKKKSIIKELCPLCNQLTIINCWRSFFPFFLIDRQKYKTNMIYYIISRSLRKNNCSRVAKIRKSKVWWFIPICRIDTSTLSTPSHTFCSSVHRYCLRVVLLYTCISVVYCVIEIYCSFRHYLPCSAIFSHFCFVEQYCDGL